MLNLEPIKERLAKATPGEWCLTQSDRNGEYGISQVAHRVDGDMWARGKWIAAVERPNDVDLIVHAPTDLTELIVEIEQLRERRERDRVLIDRWDKLLDSLLEGDPTDAEITAAAASLPPMWEHHLHFCECDDAAPGDPDAYMTPVCQNSYRQSFARRRRYARQALIAARNAAKGLNNERHYLDD